MKNIRDKNVVQRLWLALVILLALAIPLHQSGPAHAQDSKAPPQAQQVVSGPFDGQLLYRKAFETLRDGHYKLQDATARAKWVAQWEDKHAGDGMLKTEEGTDKAITEMKLSLGERFDYYNPPARFQEEQQAADATLVGIGASVQVKGIAPILKALPRNATREQVDAATKITAEHPLVIGEAPEDGSPAGKAGLRAGDYLTAIDGKSVIGKTINQVVAEIRGKPDTAVTVTFARSDGQGGRSVQTVEMRRARVVAHAAKYKDLGDGIAYVRLGNFVSQFSVQEMQEALTKARGAKGLILDLRHNPGGRLDYVELIAQMMLKEGPVVVTRGREGDNMVEERFTLEPDFVLGEHSVNGKDMTAKPLARLELITPEDTPIVVLVNEGSASGAELLAGILQSNHRAPVIGVPTVGKGVGQAVVELPFMRNMHVTSFEFLPAGHPMNWVGIIPDREIAQSDTFLDDPSNLANDTQMTAAKQTLMDLIAKQSDVARRRDEVKSKHEKEFHDLLQVDPNG